jgi:hypothetical protein
MQPSQVPLSSAPLGPGALAWSEDNVLAVECGSRVTLLHAADAHRSRMLAPVAAAAVRSTPAAASSQGACSATIAMPLCQQAMDRCAPRFVFAWAPSPCAGTSRAHMAVTSASAPHMLADRVAFAQHTVMPAGLQQRWSVFQCSMILHNAARCISCKYGAGRPPQMATHGTAWPLVRLRGLRPGLQVTAVAFWQSLRPRARCACIRGPKYDISAGVALAPGSCARTRLLLACVLVPRCACRTHVAAALCNDIAVCNHESCPRTLG